MVTFSAMFAKRSISVFGWQAKIIGMNKRKRSFFIGLRFKERWLMTANISRGFLWMGLFKHNAIKKPQFLEALKIIFDLADYFLSIK
jgi:hypothetical protein